MSVSLEADWIPSKSALIEFADTYQINISDIVCVDMGNPHLVIFQTFSTIKDNAKIVINIRKSNFPLWCKYKFCSSKR